MTSSQSADTPTRPQTVRIKFLIGGLILLAAIAYLIVSTLRDQQEFFYTVADVTANPDRYVDKRARIAGVVLSDTIEYDGHILSFVIADIPGGTGAMQAENWETTLRAIASDPTIPHIQVVLVDQPIPDLLKNETQAIVTATVTGKLGEDGVFYADDLMLKCPSRYQEAAPE